MDKRLSTNDIPCYHLANFSSYSVPLPRSTSLTICQLEFTNNFRTFAKQEHQQQRQRPPTTPHHTTLTTRPRHRKCFIGICGKCVSQSNFNRRFSSSLAQSCAASLLHLQKAAPPPPLCRVEGGCLCTEWPQHVPWGHSFAASVHKTAPASHGITKNSLSANLYRVLSDFTTPSTTDPSTGDNARWLDGLAIRRHSPSLANTTRSSVINSPEIICTYLAINMIRQCH